MKLRFQSNSIRLRLKRTEVEQLVRTGRVQEKVVMGNGPWDTFHYAVESSHAVFKPQAILEKKGVLVQVPIEAVSRWAESEEEIGIEAKVRVGEEKELHVLIEKDFTCLHGGTKEENDDTFPNPLAKTKKP
jgi:Family of unknown function (DUF7009)